MKNGFVVLITIIVILVWYIGFMLAAGVLRWKNHRKLARFARAASGIYPLNAFMSNVTNTAFL